MSSLSCPELVEASLSALGPQFHCYTSGNRVWIVSPYLFPDSDHVEVAVEERSDGSFVVSDLGETLRHLSVVGFDPRATDRGEYLLNRIADQANVSLERGMLRRVTPRHEVGEAINAVLSASLGASRLLILARGSRPATFAEEVARLLHEIGIRSTPRYTEVGATGKRYTIDLKIESDVGEGLLQSLSPASAGGATQAVNATFRLWSDIENSRWRATLLDDRLITWRAEDTTLLRLPSQVYFWSERDEQFLPELRRHFLGNEPTDNGH